nr:hypothetical protein [Tanacetum cinerariifolium]
MPRVLLIAWERLSEIKHAFIYKRYQPEEIKELMCKLLEDVRNIREELAEFINSPSWNRPTFYEDDEEYSIQYKEYFEKSPDAVTTVLPTEKPEYSLSMGYEHLSTTPEVTESSVKKLVLIPSECEVTSDDKNECDVPVCENSPIFDDHSEILSDSNNNDISKASMEVLLVKEIIFKLIQAWDEKQIESWSLPALLLQLLNDSRTIDEMLKQHEQATKLGVQKEQEEQAAQISIPYWNFSMLDDVENPLPSNMQSATHIIITRLVANLSASTPCTASARTLKSAPKTMEEGTRGKSGKGV